MKSQVKQIDFFRVATLTGLGFALLAGGRSLDAQPRGGLGLQAKADLSGSPARETFMSRCASCHGLDGRGGEHAPDIVTSPSVSSRTDQALFDVISRGLARAGMPAFGQLLSPAEIHALVEYLRDAAKTGQSTRASGDAVKGRALFFGKAGCNQCHMISGEGGFVGRDLSDFGRHHSPAQIRLAILHPNDHLPPGSKTVTATTHDGRQWVGIIRNEDNFSLQLISEQGVFYLLTKSDLTSLKREPKSLMPDDYGSRLTPVEVSAIVSYLSGAGR
jgi:putative heme-binding domain-containing protein